MLDGTLALVNQRVQEPFEVFRGHLSLETRKLMFHTISLPKEKLQIAAIKGDLPIEVKVPLEKILEFLTMMSIWIITLKM